MAGRAGLDPERLRAATLKILDRANPASTLRPEVLELVEVFRAAGGHQADTAQQIDVGQTWLPTGLALSPQMAAMCADDFARTVVFLRGVHAAIHDRRSRFGHRPVRVLYAGCGPYATLALPLMSVLSPAEANFELLDLHAHSVASAQTVVGRLGLGAALGKCRVMDACDYRIDPDARPDVLVLELMNACLEKEPQVAVTRHLCTQAPDASIVPRSVKVDLRLVNPANEFGSVSAADGEAAVERERVMLGTVFELGRDSLLAWGDDSSTVLPAARIALPAVLDERLVPMLFTTIESHGGHRLQDYDSGLTMPRSLSIEGEIRAGATLHFEYQLGPSPGLRCRCA